MQLLRYRVDLKRKSSFFPRPVYYYAFHSITKHAPGREDNERCIVLHVPSTACTEAQIMLIRSQTQLTWTLFFGTKFSCELSELHVLHIYQGLLYIIFLKKIVALLFQNVTVYLLLFTISESSKHKTHTPFYPASDSRCAAYPRKQQSYVMDI